MRLLNVLLLGCSTFWAAQRSAADSALCVRIPTVFRHCLRAFLLCSSTFCVHFYYFFTVFQHWLRAFPLLREAFWIGLLDLIAGLDCWTGLLD